MVAVGAPEGAYNPGPRKFNFVVKPDGPVVSVTDDGRAKQIDLQ
jgi:hypothetical protein